MARINRRWIVHGGLRESAAGFLDELALKDMARLRAGCQLAMDLVHDNAEANNDPKPWFYAGLFAVADDDEARRYLAGHPLTRMVRAELRATPEQCGDFAGLESMSREIAAAIRIHQSWNAD